MARNFGVCDWTLNRIENPDVFLQAKDLGFSGVQITFDIKNKNKSLLNLKNQDIYLRESDKWGIKICSCAAVNFFESPLALSENPSETMEAFFKAMNDMGIKIMLIPFFGKGDINYGNSFRSRLGRIKSWIKKIPSKKWMYDQSMAILSDIAELAEKYSVIIGLETQLPGEKILSMVKKINSPSIKVYFDAGNMQIMGYDPLRELQKIGLSNICQIHIKELKTIIGEGVVDYKSVLTYLQNNNFSDWLVIEDSIDKRYGVQKSMKKNLDYLTSVFGNNTGDRRLAMGYGTAADSSLLAEGKAHRA